MGRMVPRRYFECKRFLNHGDTVYFVGFDNSIFTGKVLEIEHWYPFLLGTTLKSRGCCYYWLSNSGVGHSQDLGLDFFKTKREAMLSRPKFMIERGFTYTEMYWRPLSKPVRTRRIQKPINSLRYYQTFKKNAPIKANLGSRDYYKHGRSLWEATHSPFV